MDYLQRLGPLALASRLKNLGDALMQGVSKIYREMEVDFEPRWFPVTHYLYTQGPVSVTSLANELRQSHPAILQVTGVMQKQGLILLEKDKNDLRKTIIELSPEGRKLAESLDDTWADISMATKELLEENRIDLLKDISIVEKALGAEDIYSRVKRNKKEGTKDKPGSALA